MNKIITRGVFILEGMKITRNRIFLPELPVTITLLEREKVWSSIEYGSFLGFLFRRNKKGVLVEKNDLDRLEVCLMVFLECSERR